MISSSKTINKLLNILYILTASTRNYANIRDYANIILFIYLAKKGQMCVRTSLCGNSGPDKLVSIGRDLFANGPPALEGISLCSS